MPRIGSLCRVELVRQTSLLLRRGAEPPHEMGCRDGRLYDATFRDLVFGIEEISSQVNQKTGGHSFIPLLDFWCEILTRIARLDRHCIHVGTARATECEVCMSLAHRLALV